MALAIFLLVAPCLRAQGPAPTNSAKIAAITVTGEHKVPADQIISASGLKPGDVVSAQQLQEVADRLAALGLFSAVNYRYSFKGDAIALEFQVREADTVPVWFDNFPWFSDDELVGAIRQQIGLFAGESPQGGAMVDQISEVLTQLLAARKIAGQITHQLVAPPSGDGMVLEFRVEGSDVKVRSVQFGDPVAADSEKLKDRSSDIKGQPYSRFAIATFEIEQVRPLYAAQGFLQAKIGPAEIKPPAISEAAAPGVDVVIPIAPGTVYTWKSVSWSGNVATLSTTLDKMVPLKSGDPADGMKIEDTWRKIEADYQSRGYLDAKLDAQPRFDETSHQVSYTASIVEGMQYRMGDMVITGLSLDAEKALRHVWQLAPGQVFNDAYFEKFIKGLAKPSPDVFGEIPVHYTDFGHWLRPNADRHTMDVLFDFK
jgi:outer membrane protein assembly factor BamA